VAAVAAADSEIAMVIDAVVMAVIVVTAAIVVALVTTTTIDAAMEADVIVMTAIALATLIATRVVDAMTDMEAEEIAAVTVVATDVAVATMIVVMIVPLSLLLLETNPAKHANPVNLASRTLEVVETMVAATIAMQVGKWSPKRIRNRPARLCTIPSAFPPKVVGGEYSQ